MASCSSCSSRRARSRLESMPSASTKISVPNNVTLAYSIVDSSGNEMSRHIDSGEARKAWIESRKTHPEAKIIQVTV